MRSPKVVISARELELDEEIRREIEKRCFGLAEEFPEAAHFEITLTQDGNDRAAHTHVTGKGTTVAGHASADQLALAADRSLDAVAKQLRRVHDKRIFSRRREARRHSPKQG